MAQTKQNQKQKKAGKKTAKPRARTPIVRPVKQVIQYVQPKRRADATIKRYVATLADPFHPYANSRGIWSHSSHTATAVARRSNIVSVTLNPNAGGINSGVDIYIPLNCVYDPCVATVTNSAADWSGTSTQVVFGYGSANTIPSGSVVRVVSAGLRITCLDPPDYTGGKFHLFRSGVTTAGDVSAGTSGIAFGSTKTSLSERIAAAQVKPGEPITFLFSGDGTYNSPVTSAPSTLTNIPTTFEEFRLFYDASTAVAGRFEFEIVSVIEYYHDSHRAFAVPTIAHPLGETAHLGASAMLGAVGSNNAYVEASGGHNGVYGKIMGALGFVEDVGKSALRIGATAYNAIQGAKALRSAYTGLTSAAETALLLAA